MAKHLPVFTDVRAQLYLSDAIYKGKFGNDPATLKALAEHLPVFTNPEAQRDLAQAISAGKFGNDSATLKALAEHLPVFTDPEAQCSFSVAIYLGKFGTSEATLKALAEHLPVFTNIAAQRYFSVAIYLGKFGTSEATLKALAEHLPVFTDPEAQRNLAAAIFEGGFGTDDTLVKSLQSKLGDAKLAQDISPLPGYILFGNTILKGKEMLQRLNEYYGIVGDPDDSHLSSCFEDDDYYTVGIKGDIVVVYQFPKDPPLDDDCKGAARDAFDHWITETDRDAYASCKDHVAIYKFSDVDGYPTKLDYSNLRPRHVEFKHLPLYLQTAIWQEKFSPDLFRHEGVIKVIVEDVMEPLKSFVETTEGEPYGQDFLNMKAIIETCLMSHGSTVSLASGPADSAMKDRINQMCMHSCSDSESREFKVYTDIINGYWAAALPEDQLRFTYVLGHLAQSEILGYGHDDSGGAHNVANTLFYTLASYCIAKLQPEGRFKFQDTIISQCDAGVCMGVISDEILHRNSDVLGDVFSFAS